MSKSKRRVKDRCGDEDGQYGVRGMFTEGAVGEWLWPGGGNGEPLKVLREREWTDENALGKTKMRNEAHS